ncbi:MAG TPA: PPOX class F420-dependent oxidoreductase [Ktedonobacterales bacterium]
METETERDGGIDSLQGNHILLTTFRKNGEGVPTPVWYGRQGDHLYVFSLEKAGKVKRIRNSAEVQVAACTGTGRITGSTIEARARILAREEERIARRALRRKYPIAFRFSEVFANGLLRRKWAFLEITPTA